VKLDNAELIKLKILKINKTIVYKEEELFCSI
jgi:hypothetical protein